MITESILANEQIALWNGHAGRAWVDGQKSLDRLFQPIEDDLVAHALGRSSGAILDVGCGTGATTLSLARASRVPCLGVDISKPMIALARRRAEAAMTCARFLLADAAVHRFRPGCFDLIVSRFGVMFFRDQVQAFRNLRGAARRGAELHLYVWRSPAENRFMTVAERAAAPFLPGSKPGPANAPGQFAFADELYVRHILEHSGWSRIEISRADYRLTLPAAELESYYTRMGPVGRALETLAEPAREPIIAAIRPAFEEFVLGDHASFDAACWRVAAVAA